MSGSIEHRVRDRVGGPGRRARLVCGCDPIATTPRACDEPDVMLLGAYDGAIPRTLDGVVALEQRIGATLPIVQVYTAPGAIEPDQQFPLQLVTAINGSGRSRW